jgi:prostasin
LGLAEPTNQRVGVSRAQSIIHPDWTSGGGVGPDDLVLVRLASTLNFNDRVRPARLPVAGSIPTGPSTLSGWGSTGGTGATNVLQKTQKPTITIPECRRAISDMGFDGDLVDYTNLCTGPLTGGVSACSGKIQIYK